MTWVRLDDGMPDHPKIIGLSDRAFRAHVAALCYCARQLTDGFIPDRTTSQWGKRAVAELVTAGVWDQTDTGYIVHDYHDYQLSRAEVLDRREKRAAAGRRGAEARWGDGKPHGKRYGKQDGKVDGKTMPHPDPSPTTEDKPQSSVVDQGSTWPTIWTAFTTYHPTAKPTQKRRRLLASRVKEGFTDDTLLAACHGNHADPWCSGENPDGKTYHNFELIYRDAAHVEQYAALANGSTNGQANLTADDYDRISQERDQAAATQRLARQGTQ